jgi:hypothetical protein
VDDKTVVLPLVSGEEEDSSKLLLVFSSASAKLETETVPRIKTAPRDIFFKRVRCDMVVSFNFFHTHTFCLVYVIHCLKKLLRKNEGQEDASAGAGVGAAPFRKTLFLKIPRYFFRIF